MKMHPGAGKAIVVGLFIVLGVALSGTMPAHAQGTSPTLMITWKTTGSYIPSFYSGKALPTYGSNITAALTLISPQGKVLNLAGQTIYWYEDETLIGNGQSVSFSPYYEPPLTIDLQVSLPNYNGGSLTQTIGIPTSLPQAVIYAPYPNGQFSSNPLVLTAIPYFFNTTDASNLSYSWTVNGQSGAGTENPEEADISLPESTPSGSSLDVQLTIKNASDGTAGSASGNYTYESQL